MLPEFNLNFQWSEFVNNDPSRSSKVHLFLQSCSTATEQQGFALIKEITLCSGPHIGEHLPYFCSTPSSTLSSERLKGMRSDTPPPGSMKNIQEIREMSVKTATVQLSESES